MNYDALPYPSLPLMQTHPERLATQATLLGMTPVPVERCRVLELGCASGGNLLPMATLLPQSRFVGIDLSARQIDDGRELVAELQLENLELRALDIAALVSDEKLAAELGEFDYIIAHGVYSWVPAHVKEALLAVCRRHLSRQGVAYVSYNTYPGFYKRQAIREMMLFHDANRRAVSPELPLVESAQGARQLLGFMESVVGEGSGIWGRILKEEADKLRGLPDGYICHEHLETNNAPCYFYEFAAAAGRHGLQFLTEAGRLCSWEDCSPAMRKLIDLGDAASRDIVRFEQYMDFVRNQSLRRTLLVHDDVVIDRRLMPSRVLPLWVGCAAWPPAADEVTEADVRQDRELAFRSRLGTVRIAHPAFKCVLIALSNEEPRAQRFEEVVENASELLGARMEGGVVAEILMEAARTGLVSLHVYPPRFTVGISERPMVSSLTRVQAGREAVVANLIHEGVRLEAIERQIVPLLDGKHTPMEIAGKLGVAGEQVQKALEGIAGSALLIS